MVGGHNPIKIALVGSFLTTNRYSLKKIQTTVTRIINNSILFKFFIDLNIVSYNDIYFNLT